jgi:hypothetical protein
VTIHDDTVPPGSEALSEALRFSEEILRNVELNEVPLGNIALKCSRLARLLNEFGPQRMMQFEASGYPNDRDSRCRPKIHSRLRQLAL